MTLSVTTEAIEFFYEHAGFSWNPETQTEDEGRREGAVKLAEAEAWAKSAGVEFEWDDDWEVGDHKEEFGDDSAYADGGPDTCESAAAVLDGEIIGSLCCIDDATPEYRRVVEAELALEAHDALFSPVTTFLRADEDMTESTLESVRAALFGVLVKLAQPHVKHYQSDLYHDAIWIKSHVVGPYEFFFAVADTGTEIGTDEKLVRQIRPIAWQVSLTRSANGKWEATTTRLS
jgi:hypothetical protein